MKNTTVHIMALVLCAGCLLTGCGGFDVQTGKNGGVVSGEAVSGEAVLEDAVDSKKGSVPGKKYPYCNDDSFYYVSYDDELLQYKLDGTKIDMSVPGDVAKDVQEERFYIAWVDNQWVYYIVYGNEGNRAELWRVPIENQKEGERLLWDEKEKIIEKQDFAFDEFIGFYAEEDFIVYQGESESGLTNFYKFDLNTKEETPLWERGKEEQIYICLLLEDYISAAESGITVLEETDYDEEERVALYCLDLKEWKVRTIYKWKETDDSCGIVSAVEVQGDIFFLPDEKGGRVWRLQEGEERTKSFIREKDLEQKLKEINPWGIRGKEYDWYVSNIFSYNERIYLELSMAWSQEEIVQGSKVDLDCSGNIIVSCHMEDAADLRYEKDISRWLEVEPASKQDTTVRIMSEYIDVCLGANLFVEEADENMYNIETGESKVLSKNDIEYWQLYSLGYDYAE